VRLTLDIDRRSSLRLSLILFKGLFLMRKLPKKVRKTSKGFHIIYFGIKKQEKEINKLRFRLSEDKNRLKCDLKSPFRITQVLFTEKITTYYGSVIGELFWRMGIKPPINFRICPMCGKRALKSVKTWEKDKREIEIYHKNSVCRFPLRTKIPVVFRVLKRMGIETET
jgi:uncharacterized protein YbaR (Trm112 family)